MLISFFESRVMKKLYDFAFAKLLNHSYHFFSSNFSGSIIAKSKRFSKQFETLMDILSFQIWFSIVTTAGILIVLFYKIPILAWIFLGWAILYLLITFLFIRKKIQFDVEEAAADSVVTGKFSDAIINILNIKIFSSDKFEKEKFYQVTDDEEKKRLKAWYFGNFQNLVQSFLMGLLQIITLFVSVYLWYLGRISIGSLVLLQLYLANLFDILWGLGRSLTRAMKVMTDMQEMIDLFDAHVDITDPENPEVLKIRAGCISFKNVSFAYNNRASILSNFNLDIKPGERIGLVGHSGAGKSTLTKVILRFAETSGGSVTIDDQDIKKITQNDLRSAISYVPQESILFHRSLAENISYGKPKATMEEIIEVAKKAHAHEFISKLPQGYDTLVGERGIKLSGGERQRIAIARAMLKNAPILILDEATSSLDSVSEKYIQDALNELMKGKTTIVIAHRLSTIQKMDRIIVLDAGKIAEEGTHSELLEKNGIYSDLWNHQTGGFLE
jgi:ATP-binding cassette subfamily B protein